MPFSQGWGALNDGWCMKESSMGAVLPFIYKQIVSQLIFDNILLANLTTTNRVKVYKKQSMF